MTNRIPLPRRREPRPARISEMHVMGRQRDALDGRRRHSPVALIGHAEAAETGFTFAQVSDSHLGFDKPANTDVTGTFQEALNHVTGMADKPAFIIHTGDITHLSTPGAIRHRRATAECHEIADLYRSGRTRHP